METARELLAAARAAARAFEKAGLDYGKVSWDAGGGLSLALLDGSGRWHSYSEESGGWLSQVGGEGARDGR